MDNQKEWVKNVFDQAASAYGEKGCSFFTYFAEKLVEFAQVKPGEHVLDVATGKGAVLFSAAKRVGREGRAVGIDLSEKMLQEARKKAPFSGVELLQMDAEHLAFPEQQFDVVFCAFALPFFPHLAQALSECKRVLKGAGRLAVSTWGQPSSHDVWVVKRAEELGARVGLGVTALNTREALEKQLHSAGFAKIEIQEETKIFWYETPSAWWESLWTRGMRFRLEQLAAKDLEQLKQEALLKVGPGKVSEERHVLYTRALHN